MAGGICVMFHIILAGCSELENFAYLRPLLIWRGLRKYKVCTFSLKLSGEIMQHTYIR